MKADLVCKGGGIRGISLVGAISCFENNGYTWNRLAGTSIGAIIASLIAVGYTSKELTKIILELDFSLFNNKNKLSYIPILGEITSFIYNKGLYTGNEAESFLRTLYQAKGKLKFKDILINGDSKLKIIACDVSRKRLLILPNDLKEYGIDPLDFDIAKAVRMSMGIPFYYNPVQLKYHNKTSYIVDGGIVSNFPIWIFDNGDSPRWPTFGLNIYGDEENVDLKKLPSFLKYSLNVAQTSLIADDIGFLHNKDAVRIINIPTLGVKPTDFKLLQDKKNSLYKSGYNSAQRFLETWSFREYINKYRI